MIPSPHSLYSMFAVECTWITGVFVSESEDSNEDIFRHIFLPFFLSQGKSVRVESTMYQLRMTMISHGNINGGGGGAVGDGDSIFGLDSRL